MIGGEDRHGAGSVVHGGDLVPWRNIRTGIPVARTRLSPTSAVSPQSSAGCVGGTGQAVEVLSTLDTSALAAWTEGLVSLRACRGTTPSYR